MGYLPEGGRLHTCYSPVRRSPTASVATRPLPLDLHVLSLSLAFILSQDQTLRCCYLVVSLLSKRIVVKDSVPLFYDPPALCEQAATTTLEVSPSPSGLSLIYCIF